MPRVVIILEIGDVVFYEGILFDILVSAGGRHWNIALRVLPSGARRLDLLLASYSDSGLGRDGLAHCGCTCLERILDSRRPISNQQTTSIFIFSILCQAEPSDLSRLLEDNDSV
jgi:hypothetical protein